ncbi:mitochondrion organization and biogenesis protein [Colletotrichum costaricense]|uniref:Mitochondrion organization and biogenesis protein n=1 Tax=Colletotrichum costaricense TaxID=1209916 RepID=A0AAJ0E4X6_9PEZI|nr:mitochondrion organization and biogenesis protein [Colletotrichum costaricense]KAK1534321.1 mitochondrion organization and biogenesis protein [Colletotrichum costaricense]
MLCSCRLSPLRLFVQGISQLHISEPVVAPRVSQYVKNNRTLQISQASTFATSAVHNKKRDFIPFEKGGKQATSRGPLEEQPDEEPAKPKRENWQLQKEALKKKFPDGWNPRKRLSPDAIAGIKALHAQFPEEYDLKTLADKFQMSPEAIRRILRSKWQATPEEEEDRQERWFRRGVNVWSRYAELGLKPPSKWRREGVTRDPSYHQNRKEAIQRRKEEEAKENVGERLQRKLSDTIIRKQVMRLLSTETKKFEVFDLENAPPYAVLSHLWEHDEVLFQDLRDGQMLRPRAGLRKIDAACLVAQERMLRYIWIDTSCVDIESESERSEAVESSFRIFKSAALCIAYLSDVESERPLPAGHVYLTDRNLDDNLEGRFRHTFKRSRWFTRSWALPELIAPSELVFYSRGWELIGTRSELRNHLFDITGVDTFILQGGDLAKVSVARKMFWATSRNAYRLEDISYSLAGLFGVDMMPIYGEGNLSAFLRLQEHIAKTVPDPTLFAWRKDWLQKFTTWDKCKDLVNSSHLRDFLASSPGAFSHCGSMFPAKVTFDDFKLNQRDFGNDDDTAWETSSVASFQSSATTLIEGSTSTPVTSGLGNAISFLSENDTLYPLFRLAMQTPRVGPDRLRRNLTRILRSLGLELAIEAITKEEALSAVFFRVYRLAIASGVTSRIAEKSLEPIALDQPRTRAPEDAPGTLSEDPHRDEFAQLEQEDDDLGQEEGDDAPEEKEGQANELDFESIRAFVLSSGAFENMTRRLSDFVKPTFRTQAQKLVAKVLEGKDTLEDQYWIGMKDKMQVVLTELEESSPENLLLDIESTPKRLEVFQTWAETMTKEEWDWWPLPPPKHALSSTEARVGWRCRCGISRWETVPASFAGNIAMLLQKYPLASRNHTGSASNPASDPPPTSWKTDETSSLGTRSIKTSSISELSKLPDPVSSPIQDNQTGQKREYPRPRYIFLLATTGRHRLRQLPSLYLDTADFGQELRKAYRELKGFWRWWFSPYNFSHCEFVRFEKFCRNGFAHRGLEVPNTSQKDYYYNPRPALREPPVSPEEFSHVFHYAAKSEAVIWASLGLPFYDTVEALSDDTVGCIPQRYHYLDERSNRKEDFWECDDAACVGVDGSWVVSGVYD